MFPVVHVFSGYFVHLRWLQRVSDHVWPITLQPREPHFCSPYALGLPLHCQFWAVSMGESSCLCYGSVQFPIPAVHSAPRSLAYYC